MQRTCLNTAAVCVPHRSQPESCSTPGSQLCALAGSDHVSMVAGISGGRTHGRGRVLDPRRRVDVHRFNRGGSAADSSRTWKVLLRALSGVRSLSRRASDTWKRCDQRIRRVLGGESREAGGERERRRGGRALEVGPHLLLSPFPGTFPGESAM